MNRQAQASKEATKTLATIREGKNKKLLTLIPEGQSPKLYLDLIKEQIFTPDKSGKPRSDEDFLLFLYTAKRTGLDPLTGQVHAVFRWDSRLGREKMAIQTGIDGFRLVAQRTGQYAGQDDAIFTPEDESTKYPVKASVTVYKVINGSRVAFSATARWKEYASYYTTKQGQKLSPMWEKMPYTMLAKCAEALALRKGFPNELSGLYTTEEMVQADNPVADLPTPKSHDKSADKPKVMLGATDTGRVSSPPTIGDAEAKEAGEKVKAEVSEESEESKKVSKITNIAEMRKKLDSAKEEAQKKADEENKKESEKVNNA